MEPTGRTGTRTAGGCKPFRFDELDDSLVDQQGVVQIVQHALRLIDAAVVLPERPNERSGIWNAVDRARRRVQEAISVALVRLEVGTLRPLVPGVHENQPAISRMVLARVADEAPQPDLVALRRGIIVDVTAGSTPRGVVPASHDAAIDRQAHA